VVDVYGEEESAEMLEDGVFDVRNNPANAKRKQFLLNTDMASKTFARGKTMNTKGTRAITGDQYKALTGAVHGFKLSDKFLSSSGSRLRP
jgi:hypothetical protein